MPPNFKLSGKKIIGDLCWVGQEVVTSEVLRWGKDKFFFFSLSKDELLLDY